MIIQDFDSAQAITHENGFYLTSDITRLAKAIGHFELYRMITHLPGQVVEYGVFKATSLVRWATLTFRELLESPFSRRITGFDIFGAFPRHDDVAGQGMEQGQTVLAHKGLRNVELVVSKTRAVDELLHKHGLTLQNLPYTHTPSFIRKPTGPSSFL